MSVTNLWILISSDLLGKTGQQQVWLAIDPVVVETVLGCLSGLIVG